MRIIDLNRSGAERFKDANQVLQDEAFAHLGALITAQIEQLEGTAYKPPTGKELSYSRSHNGILIQGGRGSGKTTFLLNALHELQDGKQDWSDDLPQHIHVLPMIDPTLIETKEHIIIVIISLIDAALDDPSTHPDADRTKVDKARAEMAEGLGLLDGIGKSSPYGDEWEDPAWIMSRGLNKAAKGRSFEIKLQKYINEALNVLNKKAFVLAFDDVDTNFQHGHTILETIRKYLTSPQLILMLSGDLELYGRLVRRNIYTTFGKTIMKHDPQVIGDSKTGIPDAVLELEEQYLLKIVPPQSRIAILPLSGILQATDPSDVLIIPVGEKEEQKQPLLPWASGRIRQQLLENDLSDGGSNQPHPFFEVVSREHLRLLIGYLRAIGNSDPAVSRRAVFTVFETRLRVAGVQSDQLAQATFDDALLLTFQWLVTQDKPTSLIRFGVPSDANKAIILHCFALSIAQGLKGSVAACLKSLFTLNLPISMMQRDRYTRPDVRKAIFDFIWQDASPNLLEVAGRIGSIARSDANEERSSIGSLRASCFGSVGTLGAESRKVLLSKLFDISESQVATNAKTVEDLAKVLEKNKSEFSVEYWVTDLAHDREIQALSPQKGVVWFPLDDLATRCGRFNDLLNLLTYDRFSSRGESFGSISALSLFAAIGELLALEDIGDLGDLALTSVIPAFMPNVDPARGGGSDDHSDSAEGEQDADDGAQETKDHSEYDDFVKRLKAWHRFARHYVDKAGRSDADQAASSPDLKLAWVSPMMLARISERIHDQLLALDEEVTLKWKTGHILHRQITNILHAILITTSGSTRRQDSPKGSDRPFVEALRRAAADNAHKFHPLAAIVISCPLVWAFLNPDESYERSGTDTDKLRNVAKEAMIAWQEAQGKAVPPFDPEWLLPPKVTIAIGRRTSNKPQRTVLQSGFFDVLNVVPRYYPKSSGAK